MKKILAFAIIPYLLLLGVIFYIYFGPGIITGYEYLEWKGFEIHVPSGFKIKPYQSKGWDVYSLQKLSVLVKIAWISPDFDVNGLPGYSRRVVYRFSQAPGSIYFISNPRKTFEAVFAVNAAEATLYFSVSSPSVYSAVYILDKMLTGSKYRGNPLTVPRPSIPLSAYLTDFFFLGVMILPAIIMFLVFAFSGKKPSSAYFLGDTIYYEEKYVYFYRVQRFRRKGNFCYLVLTADRLMMFVFGKPQLEIRLHEEKPDIEVEGKKIIIQKAGEKIVLRPADIEKWKDALVSYL